MSQVEQFNYGVVLVAMQQDYPKCKVEVQPSAVALSPHKYVYVYFTEKEHEGLHLIVSSNLELETEPGFVVGIYPHWEEPGNNVVVATLAQVREEAKRLVAAELLGDTNQ